MLACGITLAMLVAILHPDSRSIAELATYLVVGVVVSIVVGGGALWLMDTAHIAGIRLKLVIPPILTAAIIAFNVTLIARMMFISAEDGQLQLAFLAFGTVMALLLASSIGARLARAIREVEDGAKHLAGGEYTYRLPQSALDGTRELSHLARWFNQMATSVQEAFERQRRAETERKQVVAALSHDLRTPLASIRAMIEAIDDGVVTDTETTRRYHRSIRTEVQRLSTLMDDLFELAKLDAGAFPLQREPVELEDVLSDAVEAVRGQAHQAGITISGKIEGPLPAVRIDTRQIHRVLMNLLQNSLRHTPTGGEIVLRATPGMGEAGEPAVVVRVIDGGEGILPQDLSRVFEPTYRGEASRTRRSLDTTSGGGLGLAIARGILAAHGGTIWAQSPLPQDLRTGLREYGDADSADCPGTVFSFILPADC